MNLLSIDTSRKLLSLSLRAGNQVFDLVTQDAPNQHAELLIIKCTELLAKAGITFEKLDYIVCINGPGSFTGIRVGMAASLGIAVASGAKLLAVTAWEAVAWSMGNTRGIKIIAEINLRNLILVQAFGSNIEPLIPPQTLKPEELESYLANEKTNNGWVLSSGIITGSFARQLADLLNDAGCGQFAAIPVTDNNIAESARELAEYKLENVLAFPEFTPFYLFEPDAKLPSATAGN